MMINLPPFLLSAGSPGRLPPLQDFAVHFWCCGWQGSAKASDPQSVFSCNDKRHVLELYACQVSSCKHFLHVLQPQQLTGSAAISQVECTSMNSASSPTACPIEVFLSPALLRRPTYIQIEGFAAFPAFSWPFGADLIRISK